MAAPAHAPADGIHRLMGVACRRALLFALSAMLGGVPALAQIAPTPAPAASPTPRPLDLDVSVQVVSLTAVVSNASGGFLSGLGPKDVEVYEDGRKQEVTYFRAASAVGPPIPLSVVLVLDSSGSMEKSMRFLQQAALAFVDKLEEVDTALVVQFNSSIKGSVEFTGDAERLERFVDALQAWGGTSLNDAVHYSLNRIKDQPGRKAVIIFSDGADTTSTMKEGAVIDYARAVEATVYSIGFKTESGLLGRSPRGFLRRVAEDSGGAYFFPDKVADLKTIFSGIADELHNHYALAYSPDREADGAWRAIELRLPGHKGASVRVRKGYFAVKRKRPAAAPAP